MYGLPVNEETSLEKRKNERLCDRYRFLDFGERLVRARCTCNTNRTAHAVESLRGPAFVRNACLVDQLCNNTEHRCRVHANFSRPSIN